MFRYYLFLLMLAISGSGIGIDVDVEYERIISEIVSIIKEILGYIIMSGIEIIIYILRPLYIFMIAVGIIKYTISGLSPRSRNILSGGLILAAFTEFILPLLLRVLGR